MKEKTLKKNKTTSKPRQHLVFPEQLHELISDHVSSVNSKNHKDLTLTDWILDAAIEELDRPENDFSTKRVTVSMKDKTKLAILQRIHEIYEESGDKISSSSWFLNAIFKKLKNEN